LHGRVTGHQPVAGRAGNPLATGSQKNSPARAAHAFSLHAWKAGVSVPWMFRINRASAVLMCIAFASCLNVQFRQFSLRSSNGPEMRFWYFVTTIEEQVQGLTGSPK
jgi:hypothetical protein